MLSQRPCKGTHVRIVILSCNRGPQRELGDCDVRHQLNRAWLTRGEAVWQAGWRLFPQSPGSRPGLLLGQGKGLPVPDERAENAVGREHHAERPRRHPQDVGSKQVRRNQNDGRDDPGGHDAGQPEGQEPADAPDEHDPAHAERPRSVTTSQAAAGPRHGVGRLLRHPLLSLA